ncbi:Integrase [Georgfuchsia toluolica]|uniref:Integrase n=1 Tax=Georgfuchsia toluolica TaxID=424218 RepID=A0A916J3S6_9PROT|nr:site-specific integrase [Georgfuchsia toluolica]CAG4884062.1 Integrase [Georgfuchsia toluolica]
MGKRSQLSYENAKPFEGKDRLLADGDGLYLRVRPHGTKTWIIDYEFKGERAKPTIGTYDSNGAPGKSISDWLRHGRLSVAQARAIAGSWKDARRAGHNAHREWEAQLFEEAEQFAAEVAAKAAEAALPTVANAIDQFMTKHIAGKKSAKAIGYRLDLLSDLLGDKKIFTVKRQDVISAIESIAEGRRTNKEGQHIPAKQLAGEVLIQAKRVWRFAESREWIETSCIEKLTRRDFDAKPVKREVVLRLDEVVELWRTLNDPERCKADPISIAALKLVILTGQRECEVTNAAWTELDLEAGLWKIPAERTKKNRAHLVHLAPQAVSILKALKSLTGKSAYVFESPMIEDQPIYGRSIGNALSTLFKRNALPNITKCHVHDLRRTLITRLPDLGVELFIGHKIANHVLPGVLAHYNHAEYLEQRKAALEKWADRIVTLAEEKNVIQFQRAAA